MSYRFINFSQAKAISEFAISTGWKMVVAM